MTFAGSKLSEFHAAWTTVTSHVQRGPFLVLFHSDRLVTLPRAHCHAIRAQFQFTVSLCRMLQQNSRLQWTLSGKEFESLFFSSRNIPTGGEKIWFLCERCCQKGNMPSQVWPWLLPGASDWLPALWASWTKGPPDVGSEFRQFEQQSRTVAWHFWPWLSAYVKKKSPGIPSSGI